MQDSSHRRCEFPGCNKWPLYAFEGEKAKFCSQHKDDGMVDVRSRRCQAPQCTRQPSFGFENQKPRYCAAHKAEGMVDVVSRRCEHADCRRRPLYGHEGEKGRFCSYHKNESMVDVVNKRCQHAGCKKRPVFAFEGEKGKFCSLHRSQGMVDVVSRRCDFPGCKRQPSSPVDASHARYCSLHRGEGKAGYTLLMLAGHERAGVSAQQSQQQAPYSGGGSWRGEEHGAADYPPRWEPVTTSGMAAPGSSVSQPNSPPPPAPPPAPSPKPWLWPVEPRRPAPPPVLATPSPAIGSVLSTPASTESPLQWNKQSPPLPHPAVKRHCSPHRNTYSLSPEPGMAGLTGSMASLQAAPPSPGGFPERSDNQVLPSLSATAAGLGGIPTPPSGGGYSGSGSAALPPPHGAPRTQMLSHSAGSSRGPLWGGGSSTRPPRSPSPSNMGATSGVRERRGSHDGFHSVPRSGGSGRSPNGFGTSGLSPGSSFVGPSPGGGLSGMFSPGSALSSSTSVGPSPSRSRFRGRRQLASAGANTLEDLSIVDPGPPTLERLKFFLQTPRSPRLRGVLERRSSDIILPPPHQHDQSPGSRSEGRPSFTASLFEQRPFDRSLLKRHPFVKRDLEGSIGSLSGGEQGEGEMDLAGMDIVGTGNGASGGEGGEGECSYGGGVNGLGSGVGGESSAFSGGGANHSIGSSSSFGGGGTYGGALSGFTTPRWGSGTGVSGDVFQGGSGGRTGFAGMAPGSRRHWPLQQHLHTQSVEKLPPLKHISQASMTSSSTFNTETLTPAGSTDDAPGFFSASLERRGAAVE